MFSTNKIWVSRNLELIYNIVNLRDASCDKVASFFIVSGRKLAIGVKFVVDLKNGTVETADSLNKFFWSILARSWNVKKHIILTK